MRPPVRVPVLVFPVRIDEIAGNTAIPTSSSAVPLLSGIDCSNARTPALAQSSLSGELMPLTVPLHELVIEPVVSRITKMFVGLGRPVDPRAAAVEFAVTVKLGMNRLSRPVVTVAAR